MIDSALFRHRAGFSQMPLFPASPAALAALDKRLVDHPRCTDADDVHGICLVGVLLLVYDEPTFIPQEQGRCPACLPAKVMTIGFYTYLLCTFADDVDDNPLFLCGFDY